MSKAEKLAASTSFSNAARTPSNRRQLIAQATGEAPADPTRVPVDQLAGNPDNPRHSLGDLQELADSLVRHGLRQPVSVMSRQAFVEVYPEHDSALGEATFVVINGNRRLAAARLAGLSTLAVHLSEAGADHDLGSVRAAVLVENIHRKDLEPLEEARAVAELVELHGTQAGAAEQVGKSQGWVSQRLSLLNLNPTLQEQVRRGELGVKEARSLARLAPDQQRGAAEAGQGAPARGRRTPTDTDTAQDESLPSEQTAHKPARPSEGAPVLLTLDPVWEPSIAAKEIVAAYGRERAEQLAAAIRERLK